MITATASPSRGSNTRGKIRKMFPLRSIAIVGAGVSGCLAAATLRRVLGESCDVTLVALPDDNVINGALAAVPGLHRLLELLGIDEHSLVRATRATYRLGTRFRDWNAVGDRYFQGFGSIGAKLDAVPFQHHWLRLARSGDCAAFEEFSMAAQLARLDRFAPPHNDPRSVLSLYSYAWHFDAGLLARKLREQALQLGVVELRDEIANVDIATRGEIRGLELAGGARVNADFYIDCSGPRAALAAALGVGHEDWSAWLPCDRLQTVRLDGVEGLPPYLDCQAQPDGWRFTLPLQHQTVLGRIYGSEFTSDAAIAEQLRGASSSTSAPQVHRLLRGRPREFWVRNCLLMPGEHLDPLESTGLHLAHTGITRFLAHFPASHDSLTDRGEYNRLTCEEYDRIRDLLALHYHATARDDSPFWRKCRAASPPATLAERIALFTDSARLTIAEEEHCGQDGWLAVLLGQRVLPRSYDPLAECTPVAIARNALTGMSAEMRARAASAPLHRDYLLQYGLMPARNAA